MKKKAVSRTAKTKAKTKAKAKTVKAKTNTVKVKAKAKASRSAKAPKKVKAAAAPKPKTKPKAKENETHGLTVIDLFRMKQEREQQAAQDTEAWKHKKDLPQQDQHQPEDAKGPNGKKSGFGGVRHH
jgi:hypothetical protein